MSEKIYALLLRLYPAHFLKNYGDEALQLFRDRSRDERGTLKRFTCGWIFWPTWRFRFPRNTGATLTLWPLYPSRRHLRG